MASEDGSLERSEAICNHSMGKGFWMNEPMLQSERCSLQGGLGLFTSSDNNHGPTQGSNNEGEVRVSSRECLKTWQL